jgi:hypothetical protein
VLVYFLTPQITVGTHVCNATNGAPRGTVVWIGTQTQVVNGQEYSTSVVQLDGDQVAPLSNVKACK